MSRAGDVATSLGTYRPSRPVELEIMRIALPRTRWVEPTGSRLVTALGALGLVMLGIAPAHAQDVIQQLLDSPAYRVEYRDTTLANGLRMVVVEQDFVPIVAAELFVGAGGRHDPPGRTGLAHLLEHSTAYGIPEGLWRGLVFNASTGPEWTDYFFTAHPVYLDAGLYILASTLRTTAIDIEGLEGERGVVIAEGAQRAANRPYGLSDSCLRELFTRGTPECRLPERWVAETRATTAEDLIAFHRRHYGPNGSVLVVVGAVRFAEVVARTVRWFGDLAPTPMSGPPRVPAERTRRVIELVDSLAARPRIAIAYALPAVEVQEAAVLNVLSAVLGAGASSRLHHRLVRERQLFERIEIRGFDFRLERTPGPLVIAAELPSGAGRTAAREALERELLAIATEPPTAVELARAKAGLARDFLEDTRNDGARGLAFNLGYFIVVNDDAARINTWLESLQRVNADQVSAMARRVFGPGAVTVVETVPASASDR